MFCVHVYLEDKWVEDMEPTVWRFGCVIIAPESPQPQSDPTVGSLEDVFTQLTVETKGLHTNILSHLTF